MSGSFTSNSFMRAARALPDGRRATILLVEAMLAALGCFTKRCCAEFAFPAKRRASSDFYGRRPENGFHSSGDAAMPREMRQFQKGDALGNSRLEHDPEPKVSDSKKLQTFRTRSCCKNKELERDE